MPTSPRITNFLTAARAAALSAAQPSDRPLRIAMLGWSRLCLQGREGSGLNLSVSELAAGLAAMGHHVSYLRSGIDYSLRPGMRIDPVEIWRGIACFTLINSPNLSTGNINFGNINTQIESPRQTALILDWVSAVDAQVIHIHSMEGFGFDLIKALRDRSVPVIITPHNYFYLCPQVDLLQNEKRICLDYDGGHKCIGCLPAPDPAKEIRSRRRRQSLRRWLGLSFCSAMKDSVRALRRRSRGPSAWPNPPIITCLSHAHASPGLRPDPILAPAAATPPTPAILSPDYSAQLLANTDLHLTVINEYGRRRAAGVEALTHASVILCPGEYLLKAHAAMGVPTAKLRHVRLGQPHFDLMHKVARASLFYDVAPWDTKRVARPLRLAYFGNCFPNKGLATLIAAIPLLTADVLGRIHLAVRASGDDAPFRDAMARYPQVSFLGGYDIAQLPATVGEYDVCIFPNFGLENSPFVVLEALHSGKFVIGSRLGATPDWIHPPKNGLLFDHDQPAKLAEAIASVVRGDVRIPSPWQIHHASELRGHAEYIREIDRIYAEFAPR